MISAETLKAKITTRKAAIQKLDRDRERYLAEITVFEELLAEEEAFEPPKTETPPPPEDIGESSEETANGSLQKPTRGLSTPWKGVMKRLSREEQFGYDIVVAAADKCGVELDKPGARSRMNSYLNSGYVERVEDGVYRLTQKGRAAAD
jgi:hypothetical protein